MNLLTQLELYHGVIENQRAQVPVVSRDGSLWAAAITYKMISLIVSHL